ncbi:hypothetical protein LTR17_021908 [Elasticomyces elasticus]|nr:hypothetical protein LTR17_021908 [Elasticomyces elasticus]
MEATATPTCEAPDTIVLTIPMAEVKPTGPTLTTVFQPGPPRECLLAILPIEAIRNLQQTCHLFADLYGYALPAVWNVDKLLRRFLPHPREFRAELTKHNAIICGEVALRFFDHTAAWQPGNMDVEVSNSSASYHLHWHLIKVQGYAYSAWKSQHPFRVMLDDDGEYFGFAETRTYQNLNEQTGRIKSIHVTSREPDPMVDRPAGAVQSLLEHSSTTAQLNYLSGTGAMSLYPESTFVTRRMYYTENDGKVAPGDIMYTDRGWTLHDLGASEQTRSSHPMRKVRHIGDAHSWQIEYGPDGISRIPANSAPQAEQNTWFSMDLDRRLLHRSSHDPRRKMTLRYLISCHGLLRPDQLKLFKSLAHLSAADRVHTYDSIPGRPLFFCTCHTADEYWPETGMSRSLCKLDTLRDLHQFAGTEGEQFVDVMHQASRIWSGESVGTCAPVEAMICMAEEEGEPNDI